MPRSKSSYVQNNFINGFKSDFTGLNFPEEACTDTDNCIFEKEGRVTRRKGFSLENAFVTRTIPNIDNNAHTSYLWSAIADTSQRSFVVQQVGDALTFYKVSNDNNVSNELAGLTISLLDYRPSGSTFVPGDFLCDYATTSGDLVIVNPKCDPILVKYDVANDLFTVEIITIQVRDFNGIEMDDIDLDFRPPNTFDEYVGINPEFVYNLVNNGWSKVLLDEWDIARADLPSLRDYVGLYAGIDPDIFDPSLVTDVPSTSEAIGGHFVLDAFSPNRTSVLVDETGITGVTLEETLVGTAEGTVFGNADKVNITRPNALFDGNLVQTASVSTIFNTSFLWSGKDYSTTFPKAVSSVTVTGATDAPFSSAGTVTFKLYGKAGAVGPTTFTDGTLLDTATSGTGNADSVVLTNTNALSYNYVWIQVDVIGTYTVAEISFFETTFNTVDVSSRTTVPVISTTPTTTGSASDLAIDTSSTILTYSDTNEAEIVGTITSASYTNLTNSIKPPAAGFTGSASDTVTVSLEAYDDTTSAYIEVFTTTVLGNVGTTIVVPNYASSGTFTTTYKVKFHIDRISTLSIQYIGQSIDGKFSGVPDNEDVRINAPNYVIPPFRLMTQLSGSAIGFRLTDYDNTLGPITLTTTVYGGTGSGVVRVLGYYSSSTIPTTTTDGTLLKTTSITVHSNTLLSVTDITPPTGHKYVWVVSVNYVDAAIYFSNVAYNTTSATGSIPINLPNISGATDPILNEDNLFNNVLAKPLSTSTVWKAANNFYVGKDVGSGNETTVNTVDIKCATSVTFPTVGSFSLYASNVAPTTMTSGTLLGTVVSSGIADINLVSSDTTTLFRYVWVTYTGGSGTVDVPIASLVIKDSVNEPISSIEGSVFSSDRSTLVADVSTLYDAVDSVPTSQAGGFTEQTTAYTGKSLSGPTSVSRSVIVLPTDYAIPAGYFTFKLYGKVGAAPTNAGDGVILGTASASSGTTGSITIPSTDTTTLYNHTWLTIVKTDNSTHSLRLAEVKLYRLSTSGTTVNVDPSEVFSRPTHTALFSNRICYAGVGSGVISSNIYISRVLNDNRELGKCFQRNDPTSSFNPQLLASDGIVVRIPEMVRVQKLVPQNNDLVIIASNGVWVVSGQAGRGFSADNFRITKVSPVRCESGEGVVIVEDAPVWWGEDSIYTLTYNVQFQSYDIQSLSDGSIENFLDTVPELNKRHTKGEYNFKDKTIHWLYNSDELLADVNFNRYNAELVYDTRTKAFYKHDIADTNIKIRGLLYTQPGDRLSEDIMKYPVTIDVGSNTSQLLSFADRQSETYKDWSTYNNGQYETNYVSTFTTGYLVHGEGQRFIQPNWLFLYMDYVATGASAKVQALFDWTNSGSSGKWSSKQEAYFAGKIPRDVLSRRLKIRGKGRAMQWKVTSSDGLPFSIIGWSVRESGNNEV